MDHESENCFVFSSPDIYAKGHIVHQSQRDVISCQLTQPLAPLWTGAPSFKAFDFLTIQGDIVCDEEECDFNEVVDKVYVYHDNSGIYDVGRTCKLYIVTHCCTPNSKMKRLVRDSDVHEVQKVVMRYVEFL